MAELLGTILAIWLFAAFMLCVGLTCIVMFFIAVLKFIDRKITLFFVRRPK